VKAVASCCAVYQAVDLDPNTACLALFTALEMYSVVKEGRLQLVRKLWTPEIIR